jgi:hypothetical protein
VINPSCTQIITSYTVLQTSYSNTLSTSLDFKPSFVEILGPSFRFFFFEFVNKVYRFLTRVLGKLSRKAITSCIVKLSACCIDEKFTSIQRVTHWACKSNLYSLRVITEYNCSRFDSTLLCLHLVSAASFGRSTLLRSWSTLL